MAYGPTLRSAIKAVSKALNEFAAERGWKIGEYEILFSVSPEWRFIRAFIVVKDFEGLSERDMWGQVWNHLEKAMKSTPDVGPSISLSVHSWDQIKPGGIYSIPPDYVDDEELLATARLAN